MYSSDIQWRERTKKESASELHRSPYKGQHSPGSEKGREVKGAWQLSLGCLSKVNVTGSIRQRGDHSLAVDLELGVLMPLSAFHAGIYFPSTNRIANVVCMYVYFWAWLCKKYPLRKEQQSLLHRVHSSQAFLAFSSLANEVPCHTVCRACVLCMEECSVSQVYLIW